MHKNGRNSSHVVPFVYSRLLYTGMSGGSESGLGGIVCERYCDSLASLYGLDIRQWICDVLGYTCTGRLSAIPTCALGWHVLSQVIT